MNNVAESLTQGEKALGYDSKSINCQLATPDAFNHTLDADIHVCHTHFPDSVSRRITRPYKRVYFVHGTPEHTFSTSLETGLVGNYGHGDSWMLVQYNLQHADAVVTSWPRHQALLKSLCDRNTKVHLVPMGVDKTFWCPGPSDGKFAGEPSLFTAENCHQIKWPLDLFIAWPWVYPRLKTSPLLHAAYLPLDQHRWFFPLVNRNGCSYGSIITKATFFPSALRNTFRSVDYYIGLVRYGDFNRISLEANAVGTKTISYRGNPYSDYWVTEGDQRVIADELFAILSGHVPPRDKTPVPDLSEMSKAMIEIYKSL
jgi:hypothetical protein